MGELVNGREQSAPRQFFEPRYAWRFGMDAPWEFTHETLRGLESLRVPVLRVDTTYKKDRPDSVEAQAVVLSARAVAFAFLEQAFDGQRSDEELARCVDESVRWSTWADEALRLDDELYIREGEVSFNIRAGHLIEEETPQAG